MTTITDDFLQKFHTLEGTSLSERKRNFYKLLHENAALKENPVVDSIVANLQPRTYLETLFKLDLLIYFRRTQELLHIIKTGNDVFVSKIAKQTWFFKDAFVGVPPEQLVDEILPSMSFGVRMKILRKLSRYMGCENFEAVYDRVAKRYGVFIASQFITGCGPEKVRDILRNYPLKLTGTQLKIFHGKDPGFVEFYFALPRNSVCSNQNKQFLKYLFNNDRVLYDRLKAQYAIFVKLGRRATKKFVAEKKNDVIRNPHDFNYLDMKAVLRKLGKEAVQLFTNALPPKVEYCLNSNRLFSSFSQKYRYSLFIKVFQDHYKIKLEDHPLLINEDILRLVPNNSERAFLAKAKVNTGCDEYVKYLVPQESIQLIKEKINLTSDIYERGKLIKYLIETCYINDDIDALLTVMKYFCHRHKNDELDVHLQFINNIQNLFGFKRFTEEMWNCLNELLAIHMLKFNYTETTHQKIQTLPLMSFNLGTTPKQKLSYLEYLFKKGENIDGLIDEYLSTSGAFPNYRKYDQNFGKHILLRAIKMAKESTEPGDVDCNCGLIREIDDWNSVSDDKLSFYDFPTLVTTFNYVIRSYKYQKFHYNYSNLYDHFRRKIFTTDNNQFRQEYLQVYWESNGFINLRDIEWFLKYDPATIVSNFPTVVNFLTEATDSKVLRLWYCIKKHSHLQIDANAIESCLSKLNDDKCLEMKPKLVPCLSVLMEAKTYAALADSFKPENKKLDLKNEKEVRLYNLQIVLAKSFKNTRCYEVLPSLLNYCAGDYFKYALRSLYSFMYHTPENKLPEYLNYLSGKAVSVRKHALFLACELCTCLEVENMLRTLNHQEGVQSLQKHMFSTAIQYFVKNPTDSFFELVKLTMQFIVAADDESLKNLVKYLQKIPNKYKAEYVTVVWEHVEKIVEIWEKLAPLKRSILQSIDVKIARSLPLDFGINIIQQHYMTKKNLSNMTTFMFTFLTAKDEKENVYATIFAIVDCQSKNDIFNFLRDWFSRIITLDGDLQFLQRFVDYYEKNITLIEDFYDYVKVFFLRLRLENPSRIVPVPSVAAKLLTFLEQLVSSCGDAVIYLFAKEMNTHLSNFQSETITKHDFYCEMIEQRPVPTVAVLLLHVIFEPRKDAEKKTFCKIIHQIQQINDVGVQINLNCKFKDFLTTKVFCQYLASLPGSEVMDAEPASA